MCLSPTPRATQTCASELWMTVTRVADGREVDDEDRAICAYVAASVTSHADFFDFIADKMAKREATPPARGYDRALSEVLWTAAESLVGDDRAYPLARNSTSGLRAFAADVLAVSRGDVERAKALDSLIDRACHTTVPWNMRF